MLLLQRTSVLSRDVGRNSVVMITSGSTCAYTKVKPSLTCSAITELIVLLTKTRAPFPPCALKSVSMLQCTVCLFVFDLFPTYGLRPPVGPSSMYLASGQNYCIFTFSCLSLTMVSTCRRSLQSRAMDAECMKYCRRVRSGHWSWTRNGNEIEKVASTSKDETLPATSYCRLKSST